MMSDLDLDVIEARAAHPRGEQAIDLLDEQIDTIRGAGAARCGDATFDALCSELQARRMHAREDVPALVAEVRALRAENERLFDQAASISADLTELQYQAKHAAEVNRNIAGVLGFEAGMREAEAEVRALRAKNERLREAAEDALGTLSGDDHALTRAQVFGRLVAALAPAPQAEQTEAPQEGGSDDRATE